MKDDLIASLQKLQKGSNIKRGDATMRAARVSTPAQDEEDKASMRTDVQRVADTFQPMQPWIIRQLLGPMMGRLWALSMCSPTPEMVQVAVEAFGNPEPDFSYALRSASFRRRYRNARKKEMMPSLKAEAKEHKWGLFRSFLDEVEESLYRRGYRLDDTRIPKVGQLLAEYAARTEELMKELNLQPRVLREVLSPAKTLGYIRARNALQLLGGNDNYYTHLISLIYEIRRKHDEMKLSREHVNYLIKRLIERLPPEIGRLAKELKSLQVDEGGSGLKMKIFVDELLEVLSPEDKILPIIPIIMHYFFIETLPSVPSDEASSHKRLPLDDQKAELIAGGQESTGAWHYTPSGRKPLYKLPTQQEEPLDDSERLAIFISLAGINIDDLTPKERHRLLELLKAIDMGHNFASKKGLSIADYYGDRADSEKTQRSRLFQKIKRLASHNSLKD